MYRTGNVYDDIVNTIIDIYIDYDIRTFPIDEREVCDKMGVVLIPYSEIEEKPRKILIKRSPYGFFVKAINSNPPKIYYNDISRNKGSIRFTIFHELKHYVFEDEDDSKDDLADYFSRYFMCPIIYLILNEIDTVDKIMAYCGTSKEAAKNVSINITNRRNKHGREIFDFEKRLIEHLNPKLLK
jgi:Zn-dependent peptidase ImmA (M78 family)